MRPLPVARTTCRLFVLAQGLHAAELLARGHWAVAAAMALLASVTHVAARQMAPQSAASPRRLLVAGDGGLYVHSIGGATEAAALHADSLWLGNSVLLVLQVRSRTHRVLLGPGNLDPVTLATLRRRLRGAAVVPAEPGVDSSPVPIPRTGAIEQITRGLPL